MACVTRGQLAAPPVAHAFGGDMGRQASFRVDNVATLGFLQPMSRVIALVQSSRAQEAAAAASDGGAGGGGHY